MEKDSVKDAASELKLQLVTAEQEVSRLEMQLKVKQKVVDEFDAKLADATSSNDFLRQRCAQLESLPDSLMVAFDQKYLDQQAEIERLNADNMTLMKRLEEK